MKNYWTATFALLALAGLLAPDACAQRSDRHSSRASNSRQSESHYEDDSGDTDEDRNRNNRSGSDNSDQPSDRYSSQYGNDRTRTSRDYGEERAAAFSGDSDEPMSERQSLSRSYRSSRQNRDFDQDNNDAPHSSTRTDRQNRFDEQTSQFKDDEYSSRSYQPRGNRSAGRTEESRHDYSDGIWNRSLSSGERSRSGQSDGSESQSWAEWLFNRGDKRDESRGEQNEEFASGVDEFIRQHDEDEDNYLSRSEMPQGLLESFHDLDRDGDDHLSRGELQRHGMVMTQRLQRQARSSHGSENRSQGSSQSSSQSAVHVVPVEVTYIWVMDTDRGQAKLSDLQRAYDLLRRLDANDDGNITRSELRDRREQVVSRWIEHGFDRLDENEDDAISRQEAAGSMLQERFDRLDTNRDDQLTRSELRRSAEQASQQWGPQDEDAYLSEGQGDDSRR